MLNSVGFVNTLEPELSSPKDPGFKWLTITLHVLSQKRQWVFSFLSIALHMDSS
jgi:hypothetical protein